MLDPAGALGVEAFPRQRAAKRGFDFFFAGKYLIENALVFSGITSVDIEFRDSIFLDDRIVEAKAANAGAAAL